MRTSTAYFAGVGTMVVAVAAGLGGGYFAANILSPPTGMVSKLERRMSAQPIPVNTAPSEPVSHVAVTAPAPSATAPVEEKTANNAPPAAQPAPAAPLPAKAVQQSSEKSAAPLEAFARARDVDIKRAAAEKRRAERRQRWEERRRFRQPREQELEAVEARVREVTEPRQAVAAEPARSEAPRIRLFDLD